MSGLGTFSGGGLGMGLAFQLKDEFTATAAKINGSMGALEANADKLATRVDDSMKTIASGFKLAAAGAIIVAPFVMGITAASDLEENINKVDVAFGMYAAKVKSFANTSLDVFGVDKIQALDMMALFGDMSTGMGIPQKKAAELSMSLARLAGDLSSFKNISADVAQNALKGIFTGETESLKGLGFVMTQANLDVFAAQKGMTKMYKDMNEQEKVMLRYNFIMERSKNAVGDFVRTSDGYANTKRVFQGALTEVSATLGAILMPVVAKVMKGLTVLFRIFEKFTKTTFGKTILTIIATLGVLLLVLGLGKMAMGGFTLGIAKMALMFTGATQANILFTLSTKGAIPALRAMGAAAWSSLGPYALIAAAIMVIIYATVKLVKWMKKSTEIFNSGEYMNAAKPMEYLTEKYGRWTAKMVKIMGVWQGVKAIFSSWNGKTFELDADLEAKLDKLGIKQLVLDLGTWVVRIKTFLMGLKEGFVQAFTAVKKVVGVVFGYIKRAVQPLIDKLYDWGIMVKSNTSDINKWAQAGKILAYVIMASLIPPIVMLAALLVGIAAVMLPIILIVGGIIALFRNWGNIVDWLKEKWTQFTDWLGGLWSGLYNAGANLVQGIWDGMKSIWQSIKDWFSLEVELLIAPIKAALEWLGLLDEKSTGMNFSSNYSTDASQFIPQPIMANTAAMGNSMAWQKGQASNNSPYVIDKSSTNTESIQNTIILDGEAIYNNVQKRSNLNNGRS